MAKVVVAVHFREFPQYMAVKPSLPWPIFHCFPVRQS